MERRLDYDFIKGLLILGVVWGHVIFYGPSVESSFVLPFWQEPYTYIHFFNMPLFIFVSAVFQRQCFSIDDVIQRLKKSINRLVVPLISWMAILIILRLIYALLVTKDFSVNMLYSIVRGAPSVMWFFICLFLCVSLYLPLSWIRSIHPKIGISLFILSPFVLMLIPSNLYYFPFMWLIYLAGRVYQQKEQKIEVLLKRGWIPKVCIAAMLVISIIGALCFPEELTFYRTTNYLGEVSPLILIIRWGLYLLSTLSALLVFKLIYNFIHQLAVGRFIVWIGKRTLFIYAFHMVFILTLYQYLCSSAFDSFWLMFYPNPYIKLFVYAPLAAIILCGLLSVLQDVIQGNRFIRKYLLGM